MIDLAVIFSGSLAVLLIAGWLTMTVLGNQRRLRARVEKIGERARPMSAGERRARQLKRRTETSSPFLESLANRLLPRPDMIRGRLQRTGKNLSLIHI